MLTRTAVEFKNIDQTASSPLAKELFKFPYVKEIFIDENYISVTKYDINNWDEITLELRSYIKQFIENGGTVLEENFVQETLVEETKKTEDFDNLDVTSQKIINILEEYVKPAVAADGGNIAFESYNEEDKVVKVILQGACSGCPSSTFTLKSGIESLLKTMLNDDTIIVEAANA
jgi:Fe-S cluster biogenesis protein NfuA